MSDTAASGKSAQAQDPAVIEAEIRVCLEEWIDAVNDGSVDVVAALYAPKAVLLATFDPVPLSTPTGRRNYFVNFLARKNLTASIEECRVAALGDNAGEASGLYAFRFVDQNGKPQTVKARFTFVYARQPEGDFLITAHHSSQAPANANVPRTG